MRLEEVRTGFLLSLDLGTVDVYICHSRNRNKTTSNVTNRNKTSDERNAECLAGGLGRGTEIGMGRHCTCCWCPDRSREHALLLSGPRGWVCTGLHFQY